MASADNPLQSSYPSSPSTISLKTFHIAGILVDVYGIDELPNQCKSISCLWLLHPRLQKKETMKKFAETSLTDWHQRQAGSPSCAAKGFLAVAFDHRNHGTRLVNELANESWRKGNNSHAQDMFSIIHGTALDTSILMDHLASYIFHGPNGPPIDQHIVAGVSLGGHSTWQLLFSDPRVTAGVVIIGCPDYARVMKDRARLSQRKTFTESQGEDFFGSKDFPKALVSSLAKWDPKGITFGSSKISSKPSAAEQKQIRAILDGRIKGKSILVCSGGADKLVPYRCSEPYLKFLKNAVGGWYADGNVYVEDNVYPGIGHEYSAEMVKDSTRFISDILAGITPGSSKTDSKI